MLKAGAQESTLQLPMTLSIPSCSRLRKLAARAPGGSYCYAHERSQPLALFAGSWAREWSARSPFLAMMDQA